MLTLQLAKVAATFDMVLLSLLLLRCRSVGPSSPAADSASTGHPGSVTAAARGRQGFGAARARGFAAAAWGHAQPCAGPVGSAKHTTGGSV
jgi:hypothetical protein